MILFEGNDLGHVSEKEHGAIDAEVERGERDRLSKESMGQNCKGFFQCLGLGFYKGSKEC